MLLYYHKRLKHEKIRYISSNQERITYTVTATDTYLFLVHNYENNMDYNLFITQELTDTGETPPETPPDTPRIAGYQIGLLISVIGASILFIIRRKESIQK